LSTDPTLCVVAQGGSSSEAMDLVTRHQPDVLLLDVEIPGESAESTVRWMRRTFPAISVIILTMHGDRVLESQLLRAGAAKFVSKTVESSTLIEIVKRVSKSTPQLPLQSGTPESIDRLRILTIRELEVLRMIAQAYTNRDISRHLHIAEGTVKRHTTNMYVKLDATSRIDAIRKAARLGLLS